MLAPGGDFCTFSPSVLALIFNLPGIDQCYKPEVPIAWHTTIPKGVRLDLWSRMSKICTSIRYSPRDALCRRLPRLCCSVPKTLHSSISNWVFLPQFCILTPLYLVQSEEVARFLLHRGVSLNWTWARDEMSGDFIPGLRDKTSRDISRLLWKFSVHR